MTQTITVQYSCHQCGVHRREVAVPARGEEDVVTWMSDSCIVAVAADHARVSPSCRAETISETLIPVSGADKIGGVIKN